MNELDRELAKVLGAEFNWGQYIRSIAVHQAKQFGKSAILDDIVTDVVTDLFIAAKDGKLAVALVKAKGDTEDATLNNVKGVVMQAAKFRVSDARRKWDRWLNRTTQFSQIVTRDGADNGAGDVAAHSDTTGEYEAYKPLLANELELMAVRAEGRKETKLARRLRLAAQIVPGKLDGKTISELQAEFGVKSTATMQAIFDDIGQATARVAGRLQDPTLLAGTAAVEVA